MRKLKRVFIANRGEIAARVARTARRLGIETAVLSSRAELPKFLAPYITHPVWVKEENAGVYLNAEFLVENARKAGADCIHPGFGFLSENYLFAEFTEKCGLTWIGPRPHAMKEMASKGRAREIAMSIGVPCTQGLNGQNWLKEEDQEKIFAFARAQGYPLLMKAAMGGGGKGMRLVRHEGELREAAERAYSEALHAFKDGTLIVEPYLETSRHVEVQVLGDMSGQVAIIGDRDCSLQRRHQKVFEEAPAAMIPPITRRKLHDAARALSQKVSYLSAGTVEFLLDWRENLRGKDDIPFYFLEMNTRLQVEHPVSEEVTSLDLVEWQFRVATGETLPPHLLNPVPKGHAIEARLYAEDPKKGFLPSPGKVLGFFPGEGQSIRWEVGIDSSDEISPFFDPMIGKVIAYGETREVAIRRLEEALEKTLIVGVTTGREFLIETLKSSNFREQVQATRFFGDNLQGIIANLDKREELLRSKFATKNLFVPRVEVEDNFDASLAAAYFGEGDLRFTALERLPDGRYLGLAECSTNDEVSQFRVLGHTQDEIFSTYLLCEGVLFREKTYLSAQAYRDDALSLKGSAGGSGMLMAPVPGRLVKICKKEGEAVALDETIFVIESMKMEFQIKSAQAGQMGPIFVKLGEQLGAEAKLGEIQGVS